MLSKGGVLIAAAAVIMLTPLILHAQTESEFQPSERKVTIIGSGLRDEKFDRTGIASSSGIDRFLNLEKVVRQDISLINVPDGNDWNDSTRIIANYYFGYGAWVPMVGLSMGYVQDDNENVRYVAGPEIGLKYFLNPSAFLYGLLEYQLHFDDAADVDNFYDNGRFVYGIGLGLTFSY